MYIVDVALYKFSYWKTNQKSVYINQVSFTTHKRLPLWKHSNSRLLCCELKLIPSTLKVESCQYEIIYWTIWFANLLPVHLECVLLLERSDPTFCISTESTCGAVNWRIYRHLELIKSNPLHSIISKAFVTETLVAFGVQFSELILHYSCVKIDFPKQSFSLLSEQKLIMFSLIDLIRIWNGWVRGVLFFYLF